MGKTAPKVKLDLDKKRTLIMDLEAMCDFEDETGVSLLNGGQLNYLGMKELKILLWACLRHEDESLTQTQVGRMVHMGNLQEVFAAIGKAYNVALPEQEGEPDPLASQNPSDG